MPKRNQPKMQTIPPGEHSSITFNPADYTVTTSPTALIFTAAKDGTPVTIGHPPPPRPPGNEVFALKKGDQLTLSVNDNQVTILSYQEFTLPNRPLRRKPKRR